MMVQNAKLTFAEFQVEVVAVLRKVVTMQEATIESVSSATTPAELIAEINTAIVRYGITGSSRHDLQDIKRFVKALY